MLPTLQGERLTLRPATEDDLPMLLAMLREPSVAEWWGEPDDEGNRQELLDGLAIVVGGGVAGWLGAWEETDPMYPSVGLDITLTTSHQDKGLGPEALRLAIDHYVKKGHHRFTIDPAVHNERAIRCYASVGFKPVGVMRDYERVDDGPWHDALLMDLLAHELIS